MWMLSFVLFCHFMNNVPVAYSSNEGNVETTTKLNLVDDIDMTMTQDIFDIGTQDEDRSLVNVLIFEGVELRVATAGSDKIWENGTVPYEISNNYTRNDSDIIMEAISDFHNMTCVNFIPRKNESSYIFIMPGSGCSSFVGKVPKGQNVSLGASCVLKGIVLHELMHALGFFHEQNRPDRDEFVKIVFDNIQEDAVGNFKKVSPDEVHTFNTSYDFGSVMHYGEFAFAINRSEPTIIPLQENVTIEQRDGFSEKDVLEINLLYNCPEKNDTQKNDSEDNTPKEGSEDSYAKEESKKSKKNQRRQRRPLKKLKGY